MNTNNSDDPRVLFVCKTNTLGGMERVFGNLSTVWQTQYPRTSHFVVLSTSSRLKDFFEPYHNPRVIEPIRVVSKKPLWWRFLIRSAGLPRSHTIVSFSNDLTLVLGLLSFIGVSRYRLVARGLTNFSKENRLRASKRLPTSFLTSLLQVAYRGVDAVIVQSNGMAHDYHQTFKIAHDRLHVIPNPVSPGLIAPPEESRDESIEHSEGTLFLFIGRLEPIKQVHILLNSFAEVVEQMPETRLLLVGTGSQYGRLKQQATDLDLERNVTFIEYTDDVQSLYRRAAATVLTSASEGLPNVLIESITVGTPVVSFNCPSGPREIIVDGENGILVPNNDQISLVRVMLGIAKGNIVFSRECVRHTAARFLPEKVVEAYAEIISPRS